MNEESVKARLLRLNQELHDPRFSGRDLSAVIGIWEQAADNFRKANFGLANEMIDEAYRTLLGDATAGLTQAPQTSEQPSQATAQAQLVPVYEVYEDDRQDLFGNLSANAASYVLLAARTMVQPSKVFSQVASNKPAGEMLASFLLFGVSSALASWSVASFLGYKVSFLEYFGFMTAVGFVFCLIAPAGIIELLRRSGAKASFPQTALVFGFSLTPVTLSLLAVVYLVYTSGVSSQGTILDQSHLLVLACANLMVVVGWVWSLFIQGTGLSIVHKLEQNGCIIAAAEVGAGCILLLLAASAVGIYLNMRGT